MSKAVSAKIKPRAAAPTPQQQALSYIAAGLRVMPISMPKASPAVPAGWYGRDKPDACAEPSAFRPTHHVGILCGRVLGEESGRCWELCGLDRDGDAEWVDLERALGYALPPTLSSKGDRHRYYWLPAGHGIRQVNGLVRQIDLRSDHGGYMREPWEWDSPCGFDLTAVAELDTDTVEALRVLRGMHDSPDGGYASDLPEPAPLDDYAAEALISAAVEEWPAAGQGRHTCSMALGGALRRAGVDRDSAEAVARAVVETVQSPPQRLAAALDAWERADRGEPAYGEHTLSQTLLDGGPKTLEAFASVKRPDPVVDSIVARWEQRRVQANAPEPTKAPSGPAAPSDAEALACLPSWVRAHVLAAQEELRTPLAMNIGFAIGALAASCAGRLTVRVTHSYSFHTALYVCVVGSPSDYKSPAHNMACRPINAWAAQAANDQRPLLTEHEEYRAECKAKRDALKDKRTRGYGPDDRQPVTPEETALAIKLAEPEPVPFRYVVGDVTNEKLADMLAQHGRLACLSSEAGKVFSVLEGAYAGKAELGVWLKAYDGEHDPVDRLNRVAEVPRYPYTVLSACLAIQPSVLDGLGSNASLSGQGFMQRFCWVISESVPVRWAPGEEPEPMPRDVATAYDQHLTALLERPAYEVRLSDEARKGAYLTYRDSLETRKKGDLGTTKEIEGWAGKQLQRVGRIAALLWAADGSEGEISSEHMARAVTLGRWLEPHAIQTLGASYSTTTAAGLATISAAHTKLGRPVGARDFASRLPKGLRDDGKTRLAWLANMVETGHLAEPAKGKYVPVSTLAAC